MKPRPLWAAGVCAKCGQELETSPERSMGGWSYDLSTLDTEDRSHERFQSPDEYRRIRCATCSAPFDYPQRQPSCPACLRAQVQTQALVATLTPALVAALAPMLIEKKESPSMATTKPALRDPDYEDEDERPSVRRATAPAPGPDYADEVRDGLWRAGAEELIETARDIIVDLLAGDSTDDEAEVSANRKVIAAAFKGRTGTAICAAAAGCALAVSETYGMAVPVLEADTATRLGREFRVLGVASGAKVMLETFVGPLRDLAVNRFGNVARNAAAAMDKVSKAKGIGAKKPAASQAAG